MTAAFESSCIAGYGIWSAIDNTRQRFFGGTGRWLSCAAVLLVSCPNLLGQEQLTGSDNVAPRPVVAPSEDPTGTILAKAKRARAHLAAKQWSDAAERYTELVALNPDESGYRTRLATAFYQLGQYERAIETYDELLAMGSWGHPSIHWYNKACCYSLNGDTDAALDSLQKSLDLGFMDRGELLRTDSDLDPIRDLSRFNAITGVMPPDGLERVAAWNYDIDFFAKRVKRIHHTLSRTEDHVEFDAAIAELKRNVPKLKDAEVVAGLQRVIVLLRDGHSHVQL